MSDFHATWSLVRGRFDDSVKNLNHAQLNFRLHPGTLTIGEMVLHTVGVEVWFMSQLLGTELNGLEQRLAAAATDGTINDKPFPFSADEITPALIEEALSLGRSRVESHIQNPDPLRGIKITSALGPIIDGTGAFARLAYHPSYHHAQVYMISSSPAFPK